MTSRHNTATINDEEMGTSTTYTNDACVQFCEDMFQAGLNVEHYRGRFYWQGPAVRVDSLQDALSETKVKCQHDSMGLGFIVYPVAKDEGEHSELPE